MEESPDILAKAWEIAQARVALREHGKKELTDLLVKREIPRDVAESVVEDLVLRGAIDDVRYTRVVTRGQAMRGKGPRYIQAKMFRKGVRADLGQIREMYAEVAPEDEVSAARRVVDLRYPQAAEDPKTRARALRALLSRGFTMDVARQALAKPKAD